MGNEIKLCIDGTNYIRFETEILPRQLAMLNTTVKEQYAGFIQSIEAVTRGFLGVASARVVIYIPEWNAVEFGQDDQF